MTTAQHFVFENQTARQTLFVLMTCLLVSACGRPSRLATPEETSLSSSLNGVDYQMLNQSVFAPKCIGCHAAFGTYEGLMASGVVVSMNPAQSVLYQKVSSGAMPKGGPVLPASAVQAIYDWISAGAPKAIAGNPLPAPGTPTTPTTPGAPVPPPPTTPPPVGTAPVSPTFAYLKAYVFDARCVICHSGSSPAAGYNLSTYDGVKAGGRVLAGNSSGSVLFQRVNSNSMPATGAPLSTEIKQAIAQWIDNGALNDAPSGGVTPPPAPAPLPPLSATFSSIMANIIEPKCLGCHNATTRAKGVVLETYAGVMQQITPRSPTRSQLYEEVEDNSMPQTGTPLTTAQKEAIRQWINAGALNN